MLLVDAPIAEPTPYVPKDGADRQLDIPEIIPQRTPHIGPQTDRRSWLIELEAATGEHRHRRATHFALRAEMALEIPDGEIHEGVDYKKFRKLFQHPSITDPEDFHQMARRTLRSAFKGEVLKQTLADMEIPDPKVEDIAEQLGVTYDPRSHRRLRTGDPKHRRGSITSYHWNKAREKGQKEKFDRARQCGADSLVMFCGACNKHGRKVALTCDQHRICLHCRDRRIKKFRKRFEPAQKARMQALWKAGLMVPTRIVHGFPLHGGKWDQKFITLTLPHSGNIVADVAELPKAFRRFWRLLRDHVLKDLLKHEDKEEAKRIVKEHLAFCRVIEVTEGTNGEGHAHLHLWFVGPYIHQARIAHLWGASLSSRYQERLWELAIAAIPRIEEADPDYESCACGKPHTLAVGISSVQHALDRQRCRLMSTRLSAEAIDNIIAREKRYYVTRRNNGEELQFLWKPVVDVRECGADVADELCKYLIKDGSKIEGKLELMDPHVYAKIYAALEGRRAIACTRGLLTPLPTRGCFCGDCGSLYKRYIEHPVLNKTGPPPAQLELGEMPARRKAIPARPDVLPMTGE